jgi:hypothetical protein
MAVNPANCLIEKVLEKGTLPQIKGTRKRYHGRNRLTQGEAMNLTAEERRPVVRELRREYGRARKKEKGQILDRLEELGYNRSYARRLMRKGLAEEPGRKRGAAPQYGGAEVALLRKVWLVSDCLCGKRLAPVAGEYVRKLVWHGEVQAAREVQAKVSSMSAATMDRLLSAERARMVGRSRARTKPGTLLRDQVPVRTHGQWRDEPVGSVGMDCVGHDGGSGAGEFCQTLNLTDVATGWTELQAVRNKAQERVFKAMTAIRARFPFPLHAIHSDNGSEFINAHMVRYCSTQHLGFTRSRAGRKNDNCHVEQKNWSVVRRVAGYDRYEGDRATRALNRLYRLVRLHVNFFQPSMKLIQKQRDGSKVIKRYDTAATPYQRVLASPGVPARIKNRLRQQYARLNPAALKRTIIRRQRALQHYRLLGYAAAASPELVPATAGRLHSAAAHTQNRQRKCA